MTNFRNIVNGKEFNREMHESFRKFGQLVDKRLPEKVAVELEKTIHDSFEKESYQDGKSSKWDNRKEEVKPQRKILIGQQGGTMHRSIEVEHAGNEIKASTDVVYAPVHNEGQRAGRGAGFTMPKRQFMPIPGEANPQLDKTVEKWLDNEMDKIFN